MSIEGADKYLPKSTRIADVFSIPLLRHDLKWQARPEIINAIDAHDTNVFPLTNDLFTTGVAYFANRGPSNELQEMGTTMWGEVHQKRAKLYLADNIAGAAIQLGIPANIAASAAGHDDSPFVLTGVQLSKKLGRGTTIIILPLEFILNAKDKAIENLAQIAWIGSQVRDSANDRLHVDPQNISKRARAYEAHFLRKVLEENPRTQIPENYREIIDRTPESVFQDINYPTTVLPPTDFRAN